MTDKRRDGPPRPGRPERSSAKAGANRPKTGAKGTGFRRRDDTKSEGRAESTGPKRTYRGDRNTDARTEQRSDAGEGRRPGRTFGGGKDRKPRREAPRPTAPQQARTVDRGDDEARIAKVIARAGLCSRRDAEAWIAAGRVAVNGKVLESPAFNVSPQDKITVDGQPLAERQPTRLFLFHKPRGYVTTDRDPEGRPTIFSLLAKELPRLVTIGRLDINTEGLLLLTNDGGLARVLELPATGWLRRYRVRARGETDQAALDDLRDGVTVEDIHYAGIEATLDRRQGANVWLTMGLREGKNREIKRVLETLGLEVNRLIRLSFGPFQLGGLAEGAVEEVKTKVLRDQLGSDLAREAGVDYDGPITAAVVTQEVRRQRRAERLERESREAGHSPPGLSPPGRSPHGRGPVRGGAPARRGSSVSDRDARPRQDRPKAGPRKHISVLRDEGADSRATGRQKIERAETADRKGRAVKVERVVKTDPSAKSERAPSRNARRFAEEREGGASRSGPKRAGNGAAASAKRGPKPGGGDRTLRRRPGEPTDSRPRTRRDRDPSPPEKR